MFYFAHKDIQEHFIFDLLCDPADNLIRFSDEDDIASLLVKANIFPSKKQARKNGWTSEIKLGWSDFKIGKRKAWIFNKYEAFDFVHNMSLEEYKNFCLLESSIQKLSENCFQVNKYQLLRTW